MARPHEQPARELPGAEVWWLGEDKDLPRRVTPTRAQRHVKVEKPAKEPKPRWTVVIALLAVVLVVGGLLVVFLDISRGRLVTIFHEAPTSTTAVPRDRYTTISVDTVADKLRAADHEVDFLEVTYAPLAFEAALTHIDGEKAMILTFKNRATAEQWIARQIKPTVAKGNWVVAIGDLDLASKLALDLHADLKEGS